MTLDMKRLVFLCKHFDVRIESDDEIYLRCVKKSYTADEVLSLLEYIGSLQPDECDIIDGELRLWWD